MGETRGPNKDKLCCGLNDGHWRQNEDTKWSEKKGLEGGGNGAHNSKLGKDSFALKLTLILTCQM